MARRPFPNLRAALLVSAAVTLHSVGARANEATPGEPFSADATPEPAPHPSSGAIASRPVAAPRDKPGESSVARSGLALGVSGGANVAVPYIGAQLGYRFAKADFLEPYVDYSYGAAVSAFSFHTMGVGARTYFAAFGPLELYHQAFAGLGLSSGGTADVPKRELGERLLGAFMTQGLGADVAVYKSLHVALTVSTGYPVWLRSELAARVRF